MTTKQLSPTLALLLVHDQLLSKGGIAAPAFHPLRRAVQKHKARISAEFTRVRLLRGFTTLDGWRAFVNANHTARSGGCYSANGRTEATEDRCLRVRWVRVNTIRSNVEEQLRSTFMGWDIVPALADLWSIPQEQGKHSAKMLYIDRDIPNLLAISRDVGVTTSDAYRRGEIILQDKASCFPAYLLDATSVGGDIIDACAAPGNKTTLLAALLNDRSVVPLRRKVLAVERNKDRAVTLQKMIDWAGAAEDVSILAGQDFLQLHPRDDRWRRVEALLLDPSCSGSGMIGRDNPVELTLPEKQQPVKKFKRQRNRASPQSSKSNVLSSCGTHEITKAELKLRDQTRRLDSLASLQLRLIVHAFSFPSLKRIIYSTCSIHRAENEHVVAKALNSSIAIARGWRVLRRQDQFHGLRNWTIRGESSAFEGAFGNRTLIEEVADACIRCERGGDQATIGFFLVGFVRDSTQDSSGAVTRNTDNEEACAFIYDEDEWQGFVD